MVRMIRIYISVFDKLLDNNAPAGDAAAADNGQDRREGGGEIENGDENMGDF